MNEAEIRANRIDPLLTDAGWNIHDATHVGREIPVAGYDALPWNGFTDYCLYDAAGAVLAVVEAKKASRNPRQGEEQLRQYIAEIAKHQSIAPFGFLSNGQSAYFWEVGVANPRLVAGFFSPADLKRKCFILQHGQLLEDALINPAIAERLYQHEAIRRVAEAFTLVGAGRCST